MQLCHKRIQQPLRHECSTTTVLFHKNIVINTQKKDSLSILEEEKISNDNVLCKRTTVLFSYTFLSSHYTDFFSVFEGILLKVNRRLRYLMTIQRFPNYQVSTYFFIKQRYLIYKKINNSIIHLSYRFLGNYFYFFLSLCILYYIQRMKTNYVKRNEIKFIAKMKVIAI